VSEPRCDRLAELVLSVLLPNKQMLAVGHDRGRSTCATRYTAITFGAR
jgi:hypothetical protein